MGVRQIRLEQRSSTYWLRFNDGMLDKLKPNRPRSLQKRVQALHQFLQDSRCPPLLYPPVDSILDTEDEVYERTTVYLNGARQAPRDDMVSLLRDKFTQVPEGRRPLNWALTWEPMLDC